MKIDDLTRWRIEQLGLNGGFSHRFIAASVFGKSNDEVDETDLHRVRYALKQREVSVMAWRNGLTPLAASHARSVVKPKKRQRRRRSA